MNNNIPLIESDGIDLSFLERNLPKRMPGKNELIDARLLEGEIDVKPIPFVLEKQKKEKSIYDLLTPFIDRYHSVPSVRGIYKDSSRNCFVATDGNTLISIPSQDTIKKSEVIDPKTLLPVAANFPNYLSVIPFLGKRLIILSPFDLLSSLQGLCRANKFITDKQIYAQVVIGDITYYFDPELLFRTIKSLVLSGSRELQLEHYFPHHTKPQYTILFRDVADPRKFGVVMACMPGLYNAYKTVIATSSEWFNIPATLQHLQLALKEERNRKPGGLLFAESRLSAHQASATPETDLLQKYQQAVHSEMVLWNEKITWWENLITLLSKQLEKQNKKCENHFMGYSIKDDSGDLIMTQASREDVISFTNTLLHYDMRDNDERDIVDLESAKGALRTLSFVVEEESRVD